MADFPSPLPANVRPHAKAHHASAITFGRVD